MAVFSRLGCSVVDGASVAASPVNSYRSVQHRFFGLVNALLHRCREDTYQLIGSWQLELICAVEFRLGFFLFGLWCLGVGIKLVTAYHRCRISFKCAGKHSPLPSFLHYPLNRQLPNDTKKKKKKGKKKEKKLLQKLFFWKTTATGAGPHGQIAHSFPISGHHNSIK